MDRKTARIQILVSVPPQPPIRCGYNRGGKQHSRRRGRAPSEVGMGQSLLSPRADWGLEIVHGGPTGQIVSAFQLRFPGRPQLPVTFCREDVKLRTSGLLLFSLSAPPAKFSSSNRQSYFPCPSAVRRGTGGVGRKCFGCDCLLLLEAATRLSRRGRCPTFGIVPGMARFCDFLCRKLADVRARPIERPRGRIAGTERQTRRVVGRPPAARRLVWGKAMQRIERRAPKSLDLVGQETIEYQDAKTSR